MMKNNNSIHYSQEAAIDDYLADRLDAARREEFEQAMQTDPHLRQQVELMRHIVTAIERKEEAAAFEALKRVTNEGEFRRIVTGSHKPAIRRRPRWGIYLSAASAAAVIGILFIVGMQPEHSSASLFSDYYTAVQEYEVEPSRGGSLLPNGQQERIDAAGKLFRSGDYMAASSIYASVLEGMDRNEVPEDAMIYYGICLLETGIYADAEKVFHSMAFDQQAELQYAAQWNLALTLLKQGKRGDARMILLQLSKEKTPLSDRAATLEEKINCRRWF